MLKKLIFILSFLCFNSILSQTHEEKIKILSNSNKNQNQKILLKIRDKTKQTEKKINLFLKSKPALEVVKYNNQKFYLADIINGKPVYMTTFNAQSANSTRTNFAQSTFGLTGENLNIGIWDEGNVLINHDEFFNDEIFASTRVTTPDFTSGSTYGDHATHVGGTLIAKGVQGSAKGMAPKALLISYDWNDDEIEALNEASTNALLISNHSYGVPVQLGGTQNAPTWMMGCYNTDALIWDNIMYNNPYYLQVVSAGNDGQFTYSGGTQSGFDKLTTDKNAKNNLVVANANNPSISITGELISLSINSSSSQGPTDDGRIKPDITGDGTSVYSTLSSSNSSYGISTGTSMASPNVAGSLILLQEYYNQLNSSFMRSSTLKAIICHTADDDSSRIGPDPIFGWGLLNTLDAANLIYNQNIGNAVIEESTLNNGDVYSTQFTVSNGSPLSVTICWTDPAGADQSGSINSDIPALVNDLDLRVTSPDGTTVYFPWKLQLSNIAGSAIKGDNDVDNIENIDIETPVSGTYTMTISHKGTLTNSSQDYALVITGSDLTLSTEEVSNNDFVVWPNPATDKINYKFNKPAKTEIVMFDLLGRSVYNSNIDIQSSLNSGQIDTSHLESGVYLLKFIQGNNEVTKKIIIE